MSPRGWYLVAMLALLFLANLAMLVGMTNWPQRTREGFAQALVSSGLNLNDRRVGREGFASAMVAGKMPGIGAKKMEKFEDFLTSAGGSAFATAPMGSYDGLNLAAGMPPASQGFRGNHPDEPLAGPPVEVGPDNLFIFKNNQCKPECCGATLSCDGGCVCSTVRDRLLINSRGGNRLHDDGF